MSYSEPRRTRNKVENRQMLMGIAIMVSLAFITSVLIMFSLLD